jgi:LacI family transcriptional regulator
VQVCNEEIGVLAAEHFLERGFRHFAFFNWSHIKVNQDRRKAFFNELKRRGVEENELYLIEQPEDELLGNWHQHQKFLYDQLRKLPRPLAVFAGQDNLGSTIIETCLRHGIHVPEEVAVLGVDNVELLCEGLVVPLSSLDTRLEELGYQAAKRLDQLMKKEIRYSAPPVLISPKEVVCRQSSDVLAVDHPAVVQALQFIKDRFHDPITLEDIAEAAGMSKRGLEKAFLKYLERTPAEALRRHRLDAAKTKLTDTREKIEAIALECGYSNSSNLSLAFRKETGFTPRAYRKQFGK